MDERVFCSQASLAEPLAGTADTVGAWILLEYRPAWKSRALEDNSLAPATRAWLASTVAALGAIGIKARPQFIRQPDIDSDEVRLLFGLPGRLLAFAGTGYGFLETLDLAAIARDPARHPALDAPHYFVCTNGQRDICCARFGLPAYAALRERAGHRVWQVTHLGGHRFAPNVLVLPQGALYGRVTPAVVPGFVDTLESGSLAFGQLRGRTWYSKPVQAAEAFAGRSDLRLLHVAGDEQRAEVMFAASDQRVRVRVVRSMDGQPMLSSCAEAESGLSYPYLPG